MLLVQCPATNPDSPPYALALLSAIVRSTNRAVFCLDLNIDFYHRVAERQNDLDVVRTSSWDQACIDVWAGPEFVKAVCTKYADILEEYAVRIARHPSPIVGFSVHTSCFEFSVRLADLVKRIRPEKFIVFGGPYCFLNHRGDLLLTEYSAIDAVCTGEGERALLDILNTPNGPSEATSAIPGLILRDARGRILKGEPASRYDLADLPPADFMSFGPKRYASRILPILTSRGCINRCSFCNEGVVWGTYRHRSPESIVDEMELQRRRHPETEMFWFMDSLINGSIPMLEALCDLLIERRLGVTWTGQFAVRSGMTAALFEKMRRAGAKALACGVENGSDRVLRLMRKGYRAALAREVVTRAANVGVMSAVCIVVGFPGETEEDVRETFELVKYFHSLGVRAAINVLYLSRMSRVYEHAQEYDIDPECFGTSQKERIGDWVTRDLTNTPEIRRRRQEMIYSWTQDRFFTARRILRDQGYSL